MPNISAMSTIKTNAVKDVTDIWTIKSNVLVPVQTAWVVKSGSLVKVFERQGVPVTMSFVSPSPTGTIDAASTQTWKVSVPTVDGLVPTGTVTFSGPSGNKTVILDSNGEASTTYVHNPGQRTVSVTLSSTNGYTASAISRTISISSTATTISFTSPSYDAVYNGAQNVTWTVSVDAKHSVTPTGKIVFYGPNNEKKDVALSNGTASVTYYHGEGQRTVTAYLESNNDFHASGVAWRVRIRKSVRFQQWQTLWYQSAKQYSNHNEVGSASGSTLYSGDFGSVNIRTFTLQTLPSKPHGSAYCVSAVFHFSSLTASAWVGVGYHILSPLPTYGAMDQYGVAAFRGWTGPLAANVRYSLELGVHVAGAMNDLTFRGIVFGAYGQPVPLSQIWHDPTVDVLWEWYDWVDT